MRILVFSDSHKDIDSCAAVCKRLIGIDMIIHAGDHASDAEALAGLFPDIPVKFVSGNCDFAKAPQELIIEAAGKRIFLTHGHNYNVKSEENYTTLYYRALSLECDCAVFGHTHIGVNDTNGKFTLLNPGSIKYSRTFGVIEIEDGVLKTAICPV